MSPGELYDALTAALAHAPWHARFRRKPIVRLTQPEVEISGQVWRAEDGADYSYGYSWRQVRQMVRTLETVMAAAAEAALMEQIDLNAREIGLTDN